jgi:hypothetical protein
MMTRSRAILISLSILVCWASAATAQVVVTSFASANLGTTPGFFDLDDAATKVHPGFGLSVAFLTVGWIGIEGETVFTPSAFSGRDLVESSRLVTASGGLVVTTPARWRRAVRPYVSFGAGVAEIKSADVGRFFVIKSAVPISSASVGTWIWFGQRMGIRGSLRFVRSLRRVESDSLETWQPSIGFSLRL